ncbi:MAG: DNA-directed RNA polymerase subunit RPB10 [Candidatus Methanohalarchaeum thermophilum]|uniref:DNA-directed RNA polymerase subunit Rpo10 n=1 Tax=Methanohalarchaeum thermophilum TaxID=1903181 RepID=A0A1Q6DRZ8_METT1|nr:MAG: DNA-directed RNA polymerase subunit RPB10 [Candidatus Methanohalarchaeum thermophilum]
MIIPVRCITCGKVIAHRWEEFKERAKEGNEDPEKVLDDLGLDRYCCRRIFMSHEDLIEDIAPYH